ncbi:hypothetical protein EJP67_02300 [Variovorax guangxiensis]|uniref:Uncharacterized protein n=1 Tax=Variovorax guangxiensis TaxID=1775474 RepID=A0A433MDP4_9BURK|nr:hypothetical protein [Variovorax guangxiensis]RUR65885.1 hypothetical protein EJP67_02300 [Variovorax guangxiensis]
MADWENAPLVEDEHTAAPVVPAALAGSAAPAMTVNSGSAAVTPLSPVPNSALAAPPAPAGQPAWASAPLVDDEPVAAVEPPKPERTVLGELGHQAGLAGRAAVQGVLSLPGMVSDAATGLVNAGLDAYTDARAPTTSELVTGQKEKGFRFQRVASAAGNLMNQAGVAQPEGKLERVVQDAATGAATALTGIGAGQAVANAAAGPITKALGSALAAAPGMQAVSGATGAGAAGITRESGGGAVAQGVAGIAGALAPTAVPFAAQAGVRGVLRGGEAGRQRVADNIATFKEAAGTTPTLGQATQSRALQGAETGLTNVVGSHGIMVAKAERQAKALQESVQDLSAQLAPGANPTNAGEAIARGVATFRDNVRDTQQRLYNTLDRFVAPDAPTTVGNTLAAMKQLNAGIDGAPEISKWFVNGQLSALEKSLVSDLETALAKAAPPGSRSSLMNPAPPNLDAAALPYQAVKQLRSLVGRTMSETNMLSPIGRNKWAPVYAALSEDLGNAARAAGPQAEQAWNRANTFTRLANERMEQISSIINKDAPEHIFQAATSNLASGGTQIRRLMKSMPAENRQEVAAAVLQRLGRAKNSAQDELGSQFSSETFLTNLAAISPAARSALFNTSGFPGLQQRVNQMGRMAAVRREGASVFANPSGTARQVGLGAWWYEFAKAIGTGNPASIAKVIAVPTVGRAAAKFVTSPTVVNFAAGETRASAAAVPSALAATSRVEPTDNGRGAILDGTQPFRNRIKAGDVARQMGGRVVSHPAGGFAVLRPAG